ncbi:MAG: hypothetical protein II951_05485 [Bacteroidales bacterium]|nr:hypothetical protein [Bacteroidales bacterium]
MEFIFELFAQLLHQDNTDKAEDNAAMELNKAEATESESEEVTLAESKPVNIFSVVNFH